jgi:regulator of RNase E activity RraA
MSAAYDVLRHVTTATITTMLLKKGIRHCWMKGAMPLVPSGKRIVGPAFTLRFVPVREDLATPESWVSRSRPARRSKLMPEGCIAVADAMGVTTAGIFGDILVMRMAGAASPRWSPTASYATRSAALGPTCRFFAKARRHRLRSMD